MVIERDNGGNVLSFLFIKNYSEMKPGINEYRLYNFIYMSTKAGNPSLCCSELGQWLPREMCTDWKSTVGFWGASWGFGGLIGCSGYWVRCFQFVKIHGAVDLLHFSIYMLYLFKRQKKAINMVLHFMKFWLKQRGNWDEGIYILT